MADEVRCHRAQHQHRRTAGIRHDAPTRRHQPFCTNPIPNAPILGDADFEKLIAAVRGELLAAVDWVMTSEPGHLIMGMSSETFWDGLEGSERLRERIEARAGVAVTMGSDAARQALRRYGEIRRIGVITP